MGRTAFFLRAYNDIDHIAPVIWKFIQKDKNPILIFNTDIDYENDYRIKFLLSEGRIDLIRELDVDYMRSQQSGPGLLSKIRKRVYFLKIYVLSLKR